MNMRLRLKIIEHFGSQVHFAHVLGQDEAKVSKVVRGWKTLSKKDQKKWSRTLGCDVNEIFGKN